MRDLEYSALPRAGYTVNIFSNPIGIMQHFDKSLGIIRVLYILVYGSL